MPLDPPFPLGVVGPTPPDTLAQFPTLVAATGVDIDRPYAVTPLPDRHAQGSAGSCVAHGFSAPVEAEAQARGADVELCRMDLYYGARMLRGWQNQDSGCLLGDMALWMREHGVVSESMWPYNAGAVTTQAPPAAVVAARPKLRIEWMRLAPGAEAVVGEIARNRAVAVAFPVYGSYFSQTGVDGMTRRPSGPVQGYHCQYVVAYDPAVTVPGFAPGAFLWVNSWNGWGIPHPADPTFLRCNWVPTELMNDPSFLLEAWGLLRGLDVTA